MKNTNRYRSVKTEKPRIVSKEEFLDRLKSIKLEKEQSKQEISKKLELIEIIENRGAKTFIYKPIETRKENREQGATRFWEKVWNKIIWGE